MLEAVGEVFPEAQYQRCTVHFYRNVFSVVPRSKIKLMAKMLKAIHAQESKQASREKAKAVDGAWPAKKIRGHREEGCRFCPSSPRQADKLGLADVISDPAAFDAIEDVIKRDELGHLHSDLEKALSKLPAPQQMAIRIAYYGFPGNAG